MSATTGSARFFGEPLAGLSPDRIAAIGLIRAFQTARVFPGMTVLENVLAGAHSRTTIAPWRQMLWSAAARREERELRRRAETMLDLAGLLPLAHRPTAELSDMLRAISDGGVTILVVEHNMSLVMGVADQIVVLDAGRIIAIGPPSEIRVNQTVIEAYMGHVASRYLGLGGPAVTSRMNQSSREKLTREVRAGARSTLTFVSRL
eukprot:gene2165-2202_t